MAYVYAILVDGAIRYIGKGSGKRLLEHMRIVRRIVRERAAGLVARVPMPLYERLVAAWLDGAQIEEIVIADGLSHHDAYRREQTEIRERSDQLWNSYRGRGYGPRKAAWAKKTKEERKAHVRSAIAARLASQEWQRARATMWANKDYVAKQSETRKRIWRDPDYWKRAAPRQAALLELIRANAGIRYSELRSSDPLAATLVYRMRKRGLIEKRDGHNGGLYVTNVFLLSA